MDGWFDLVWFACLIVFGFLMVSLYPFRKKTNSASERGSYTFTKNMMIKLVIYQGGSRIDPYSQYVWTFSPTR